MGAIVNRRRAMGGGGLPYDGYIIIPKLIKNTYISGNNGVELSYTGWDSTDYIDVTPYKTFKFYSSAEDQYGAFYDAERKYICNTKTDTIPQNAVFVRCSQRSSIDINVVFSNLRTFETAILYRENAYINKNTGQEAPYNNWNIYKISSNDVYIMYSTREQASYQKDGTQYEFGKSLLYVPKEGYFLTSTTTVPTCSVFENKRVKIIDLSI